MGSRPAGRPADSNGSRRFFGTWFTNLGPLVLFPGEDGVAGSYQRRGGELRGAVVDPGEVLRGTWYESDGAPPEGEFELRLDAEGNHLSGGRRYRGETAWSSDFSGVRTTLLPAQAGGFPGGQNSHAAGPLLSGPLLGEAGADEARVWVQARDPSPLTLTLFTAQGSRDLTLTPRWEEWLCLVFPVRDLRPGQEYEYELRSAHGTTGRHRLRAGPGAEARRARVAFGSCFNHYWVPELPIFDALAAEGADTVVMLGDNCYFAEPDWQTEHTMMLAYLRNRNNPALRRLAAQVPVLAMWDNHDFGPNDADGTFTGKDQALAVFRRCWAQRANGAPDLPGVFSALRLGPVEIFLTDGRYHRGVEGETVLGAGQLGWLLQRLRQSTAPIKLVCSGTVVLGHLPIFRDWESWRRSAPGELETLLTTIDEGIPGVVFLSGDLHMAHVRHRKGRDLDTRTGPDLWEVTSSPLAIAPENARMHWPDPYLVEEIVDRENYGVVDIDLDRPGAEVRLLLKDSAGRALFDQAVDLATLMPR